MSDFEDDFGGFEVAETLEDTDEPSLLDPSAASGTQSSSGTDVSAIPWLAASIQASAQPVPAAETLKNEEPSIDWDAFSSVTSDAQQSQVPSLSKSADLQPTLVLANSDNQTASEASKLALEELESQLDTSRQENRNTRSELSKLKLDFNEISRKLETVNQELDIQKTRYQDIQSKHKAELEGMQSANQKAIGVVIEEYKESMRQANLEQQKACLQLLSDHMESEGKKYQQLISQQSDNIEEWKSQCKTDLQKENDLKVEQLKEKFEEDKAAIKAEYSTQLDLTRDKLLLLKSEALADVQTHLTGHMAQLDIRSKELVAEASDELKTFINSQVKKCADTERQNSMDYWDSHSKDLMDRLQTKLDDTIQTQKSSMESYVADKIKADNAAQKKHLSAINVYLEAASQHITAITEDTNLSLSSTDS